MSDDPNEMAASVWLDLAALPEDYPGIYRIGGVEGRLPARFRWLHPWALTALEAVNSALGLRLPLSDVLRSPIESAMARATKTGVMPPGFSGHNYGFSIDVDINAVVQKVTYHDLLQAMADQHWYPIRSDGVRGFEDWHFNWIRHDGPPKTTAVYNRGQRQLDLSNMVDDYRSILIDTQVDLMQARLKVLGLYHGEIDGLLGPHTREGALAFRRAYQLNQNLSVDTTAFHRCLALAACFKALNG